MSLAARQALLARFLDDPAFELRARSDPEGLAREAGVAADYALWLAALDPRRVAAFRKSRAHKDAVRTGSSKARPLR